MKKRTIAALSALVAGALAVTGTHPASAAVTYKSTAAANVGTYAAIDTSSNIIYSIVDTSYRTALDTYYDQTLTAVDAKTLKTKASVLVYETSDLSHGGASVIDVRLNSKTHTVWLSVTNPYGAGSIQEVNGSTLKTTRTFTGTNGYSEPGEIAVNPTTNTAYAAWDWDGVAAADNGYSGTASAPYVSALNGSTGAVTTVNLGPVPTETRYPEPGNVAFDSSNNGVYVGFNSHEYAYSSSTLKLASSVAFPSTEVSNPRLTADGSTHTIYAVGDSAVYKIAGSTNRIAGTANIGSMISQVPVVDPTIKTLYIGTGAYSETSLAKTGTLPEPATSANGSTHTIYSPGYVIARSGS